MREQPMESKSGPGSIHLALHLSLCLAAAACGDTPSAPDIDGVPPGLTGAAAGGAAAFLTDCASCHASRDGFDLAFFAYPDTTIIRRALAHVDRSTADDIVAYIRTLDVAPASRHFRPFQPAGTVLQTDREFAVRLFGEDRWPLDLAPDELLAMAPGSVPIPLPFLEWSVEPNELDWMPDRPLPAELLDADGGTLRRTIDRYYAERSMSALLEAIERFQTLTRGDTLSTRVCAGFVAFHTRATDCFEARRWMASLAGQHLLREGIEADVPLPILDLWWDVGEAAVSQTFDRVGDRAARAITFRSAATWLYLAWRFDPLREHDNPLYFAEQLRQIGFQRLAIYTQLYSMVMDPRGWEGARPYIFHLQTLNRAPVEWSYDVALWGFRVLESYQEAGILPEGVGREEAVTTLDIAERILDNEHSPLDSLSAEQKATLREIIDRLRDRLEA